MNKLLNKSNNIGPENEHTPEKFKGNFWEYFCDDCKYIKVVSSSSHRPGGNISRIIPEGHANLSQIF
jgi:hypothetical protein